MVLCNKDHIEYIIGIISPPVLGQATQGERPNNTYSELVVGQATQGIDLHFPSLLEEKKASAFEDQALVQGSWGGDFF